MKRTLLLALSLVAVAACADEEPEPPCLPTVPECAEEDFDEDGVPNQEDDFPSDEACSVQDDQNCGACGTACADREHCDDAGLCVCEAPFTGETCQSCADPRFTGETCQSCADPHFAAPQCTSCEPTWVGPLCDHCANPAFEAPMCAQCLPPFSGPECGECADPHYALPECTSCVDRFEGIGCTECADSKYTGEECDLCANPIYGGENCDTCTDPTYTGPYCTKCANPQFTGDACDICLNPKFTGENCDACTDSDGALPDCNPYPEAPSIFYQVHLPEVVLDDDGESEVFYIELPEGTSSVFVTARSPDLDSVFFTLKKVITPPPLSESVVKGAGDATCIPCANRVSAAQKVASFLIPNDPQIEVKGGEWAFKLRQTAISKIAGSPTTYPPVGGVCEVVILARTEPVPDTGVLKLHFHFTGVGGLTAEVAPEDEILQNGIDELAAILATAGIGVEVGGYHDVPGTEEDPTLVDLQSTLGWPNDLSKLLLLGQDEDVRALNVFLTGTIFQDADFGGGGVVLGVAAGVPGPAFLGPSYRSGVAVTTVWDGVSEYLGNVLAHEVGHYLGLYHSTEGSGTHDTLEDTAEDDPGNLMFWGYTHDQLALSDGQAWVARSHPLVIGDDEE
jgi:hypothetical protein